MYRRIEAGLTSRLPGRVVTRLLQHHADLRRSTYAGDWEKALVKGGKFAEAVMKVIRYLRAGDIVSNVSVDDEIKKAEQAPNLPPELRTMIPRHVRVIYEHRNKRGGGHDSFEPSEMDARVTESVADWTLAELLRLFGGMNAADALRMTRAISVKAAPFVEEIDGDVVLLTRGASAREEVALLLYTRYPDRVTKLQLFKEVTHKAAATRMAITRMSEAREIHSNDAGFTLTAVGLAFVEKWLTANNPKRAA